jgi:hypothetical protein|tara:strand:- start:308 stop:661 length:354 start_codon:yes stop_codon:yes gene_type:complete
MSRVEPYIHQTIDRTKLVSQNDILQVYEMNVFMLSNGSQTVTWDGINGETYVASIKIRQELDPMYRDRLWLIENYLEKERSMANIADEFGITATAVNQWLNKHDIPTRNRGWNTNDS